MSKAINVLKLVFFIIPWIIAFIFVTLYIDSNSEIYDTKDNYKDALNECESIKKRLVVKINLLEHKLLMPVALSNRDVEEMKKKGLNNPPQDLRDDLKKHDELIPYDGVLGGKMSFLDDKDIWILTEKWILAYFEDGHICGYMILKYDVTKEGKINWQVLDHHKC
jgi:hypothetical protein